LPATAAATVFRMTRRSFFVAPKPDTTDGRIIEISQLAGGLAHEIRNPLSTLLLNLQLLEEDLGSALDEESDVLRRGRLKIAAAVAQAARLQRMLDDFLVLVRPLGLRKTVTDLDALVQRLVDFYTPEAERHKIVLRPQFAGGALLVPLDARTFEQAVLNLLINATEAMPKGGEIIIRTSRNDYATLLEVIDTGEGMTEDVAAKVFQAFYSTKPNGTGLGLATSARIISSHGGTISMETEPMIGTRFEICLPLSGPVHQPKA
jgi:two-component system, NtrC family, sensor histidine kinase HydH